ncbi:hypothetical protein ACKWTF_008260 [Chironomus riparius]
MDNSKNLMNNDKSLCLYCDKAFSNINDQGNHVERDHKTVLNKSKGSLRKSERITKNLCSENSPFAACFYCNNKKLIKSDDLESLFQHLLAAHKDIYFGCKCKTRLFDKVSLANHKKNCELGGSGSKISDEKISEKRKSLKTSPSKGNIDLKCDTLSDSSVINANNISTAATASSSNHSVKTLPTNAITKKSDRSNVKNSNNKNVINSNEKRNNNNNKKSKISNISSSSSTTSSSSSSKTVDEYTIPLTRQKLKEPVHSNKQSSSFSSQNRSSSNKKNQQKNSRSSSSANENKNASSLHASSSSSSSSATKVQRTKTTKLISHNSQNNFELVENTQKIDTLSTEFDEDFYKNISCNVRVNLNGFIDGKVNQLQLKRPAFDRISAKVNADENEANEVPNHDEKEIHEATNFELSTPFPALLTTEQYGFSDLNTKGRRQITKNSWKWRWDLIKKYKYVNEGGKIVKKVKQITTGLKDLSQLDMWTQLSMRSRYENLNIQNGATDFDDGLNDSLSTRMMKTQNIEQLDTILDTRLMPEINIEQLQQTLVKEELIEPNEDENEFEEEKVNKEEEEILKTLRLKKLDTTKATNPALSGEWARPRRFVCIDCGQEFDLMKSLNDHKNSEHPYVVSAHYEVVGRENLEQKLYKNLFLPKKALQAKGNADAKLLSITSDSKSNEASSSSENSSNNYLTDQKERECSKCMKTIKYSNDMDIYRHILDCIEDRVWMQAKRRNKYRRSRRKTKKTVKKTRLSNDQKKITSSPFRKENIEGDTSLSNPPTPKEEIKPISNPVKGKAEVYVNDGKSNNDGMNIKSFFRVSKTTPNLPQKIVVQMIEMHQNNTHNNNSLRNSLRSSAKKLSNNPLNSPKHAANGSEEIDKLNESNALNSNEIDSPQLNVETISEEAKNETENTKINIKNISSNSTQIINTNKNNIPPALTALQIPDSDKMKSLSSPTNSSSSSLVSPTSSVPKKKKKLNDCIAMLTCKIQEKLGVNFFENTAVEIFPTEVAVKKQDENNHIASKCTPIPKPLTHIATFTPLPTINVKIPDVPQTTFTAPEQVEVIDLSIKKKPHEEDQIELEIPCHIIDKSNIQSCYSEHSKEKEISNIVPKKVDAKSRRKVVKQIEDPPKDVEKCIQKDDSIEKSIVQPDACIKENENKELNDQENSISEQLKTHNITESFKISISKDRIPNLKEILENNSVITVNNLKISESERRAFEEQKNRIMQILNKTKKTTGRAVAKKAVQKKQPVKKNLKQQQQVKDTVQKEKEVEIESPQLPEPIIGDEKNQKSKQESKAEESKPKEPEKQKESIENKIEVEAPVIEIIEPSELIVEQPKSKELKQSKVKEQSLTKIKDQPRKAKDQLPKPKEHNFPKTKELLPTKVMYKFPTDSPERELEEMPKDEKKSPESAIETNIQTKIEQAIKTTNRIRCRRLSVVVDPIIHLSPFQQSNRKIRLTNNSQQNGLYDLLTNDQLFNAIKPQLKDEIKKTCAKVANKASNKNIQNAINEVRAKAAKELAKQESMIVSAPKSIKSKANTKARRKTFSQRSRSKKKANAKNKATIKNQPEKKIEIVGESNIKQTPTKVVKESSQKKQPLKPVKTPLVELKPKKAIILEAKSMDDSVVELKPLQDPIKEIEPVVELPKVTEPIPLPNQDIVENEKPSKATTKSKASKNGAKTRNMKDNFDENIKDENSINGKEGPIIPLNEQDINLTETNDKPEEKLSLDASFLSDTSNENDIPLAKLVEISKNKNVKEKEIESFPLNDADNTSDEPLIKSSNKKKAPHKKTTLRKAPKSKAQNKSHSKSKQSKVIKIQDDVEASISEENDEDVAFKAEDVMQEEKVHILNQEEQIMHKKVDQIEEKIKIETEKPKKSTENKIEKVKSSDINNTKSKIEKENVDKLEVFNMNEDSFFNDDNDADEKINDLVNNIINSSELVDSETEKSENLKQNINENQTETKCTVCNRSFRNEKVLEKHNKTTTHLFKVKRREKRIAEQREKEAKKEIKSNEIEMDVQKPNETQTNASSSDETKIFRTKGALKTFENILAYPSNRISETINFEQTKEVKPVVITNPEIKTNPPQNSDKKIVNFENDDDDSKNEDLSRKDKIFDSLFSSIENKLQAAAAAAANNSVSQAPLQKFPFPDFNDTPHDSEVESSSASWDLKHDADIEWDADNNEPSIANAIKEKYPKKNTVKINKLKETAISIPTKSLIMGKIFKKHRDREKQKTPQADAPNNKPGIKNSLDEIFDHLKNSAEIDDKVLTCPSPKTLLKSAGGTFSPHSSHSNDMLETASQSNNNNTGSNNNSSNNINNNVYSNKKPLFPSASNKPANSNDKKTKINVKSDELPKNNNNNNINIINEEEEEDGIGKRKSRRRCAIKTKTFAETWSSDEYEELHDTNDIISIINEIEKRESIKRRKVSKSESHNVDNNVSKKNAENIESKTASDTINHHVKPNASILKTTNETNIVDKKSTQQNEKNEKKKSVQLQFPTSDVFSKEKPVNTVRKRRMSTLKDGHKSDEETFTATKDLKPLKPSISMMKKRRMSCFVPSSIFNDNPKPQVNNRALKNSTTEVISKAKVDHKTIDHKEILSDASEKCGKNQKKILSAVCNNSNSTTIITAIASSVITAAAKKKVQKHRKRPRNKVKNIAYDSDSDFELNLSRKSKASAFSDSYSEEEEDGDDISHNNKSITTSQNIITKSSNTNELTMIKEPKLLPNDLNVVTTTAPAKAAIPEDINDPMQSACNRTKRHSSEKLYYWSSSSDSDVEPGDTADGENEESQVPQQPEQHGWIVGDSHKKLVTLLAHAKIKNKIN